MSELPPPPGFDDRPPPPPAPPTSRPIPLPSIDYSLHPAVKWYWRLPVLVIGVLATLLLVAIAVASSVTALWFVVVLLVVLTVLGTTMLPSARYSRWLWRLTDRALEAEHGIWSHQTRVIPFFRIQHIDVQHGPIDRQFGLAQLRIHTASVTTTLPGLSDGIATQLRTQLLDLAAEETAVAGRDARDAV